jgi:hypothetical protein
LELALALGRQGEGAEVRRLATAASQIFQSSGLHPDQWAAIRALQNCDVVEAEWLILEQLKKAGAASVRRVPRPR